jgi:hypothetical protein
MTSEINNKCLTINFHSIMIILLSCYLGFFLIFSWRHLVASSRKMTELSIYIYKIVSEKKRLLLTHHVTGKKHLITHR